MICRIFGHDKEYVAIRTLGERPHRHNTAQGRYAHEFCKCDHDRYLDWGCEKCETLSAIGQEARWVCRRKTCPAMGQDSIARNRGIFRVEFGLLVPDKKAWCNFDQGHNSSERSK